MKSLRLVEVKQYTIEKLVCNMCTREAEVTSNNLLEEFIEINKQWGYHSEFDGEYHSFDLCPDCYKSLLERLTIPATEKNAEFDEMKTEQGVYPHANI